MAKYKVEDIRNIAIVGHATAGKTTLTDALLFKAGAVERMGSVDEGSSVSDYDDQEKEKKYSIDATFVHLEHKGKQVHILDTPGYPDFIGAALAVLNAVETAVVVVSAPAGIQVNTRRLFHEAGKRGLGRMIVINKMDADNVHFEDLIKNIRDSFGKNCVPFNVPVGQGNKFTGVVSVLNPAGASGALMDPAALRSQLVDSIVESDEALMEKYLNEGDVSAEELAAALPRALAAGTVVPIFCTAGRAQIGVTELLDGIAQFAVSPVLGKKRVAKKGTGDKAVDVVLEPKADGPALGQVFKVIHDKFVGTLAFIRIFTGHMTPDQQLANQRTGKSSRISGLLLMQGKSQQNMTEAIAGDIFAVAKIEDLHIGDTVGVGDHLPKLPIPGAPTPMYGLAVEPKARGDEQKISQSLQKIADEDTTFKITRDAQTKEMVMSGVSQLHLGVIQDRLKRRFGLEVVTKEPKIPYRETIMADAEASYRHKKQSGGRGQFGEVHLKVHPLPREFHTSEEVFEKYATKANFEKLRVDHSSYDPTHNFCFLDTIVGGTIPNQFVPAVRKGCEELIERGALAGYRMQDVAVEVFFGKDHPVDSSETAFRIAGRMAFKQAFLQARPVLLEPIVDLEITVPSQKIGDILSDLNTKRARIENQESLPGDLAVIKCKVPLAEVTRYAAQLGSITQGQGSYTMDFSHYDMVPGNVQQQIVSKATVHKDEEEE